MNARDVITKAILTCAKHSIYAQMRILARFAARIALIDLYALHQWYGIHVGSGAFKNDRPRDDGTVRHL